MAVLKKFGTAIAAMMLAMGATAHASDGDAEAAAVAKKRVDMCDNATANIASFERTLTLCRNLVTQMAASEMTNTPEQRGIQMVAIAKMRANIARIEINRSDADSLSRARGCTLIQKAVMDFAMLKEPFEGFAEFNQMGIRASSRLQQDALKCGKEFYMQRSAQFGGSRERVVAEATKPCMGDYTGAPLDRMKRCFDAMKKVADIYSEAKVMRPADTNHYTETLSHLYAQMLKQSDEIGSLEKGGCKSLPAILALDGEFVQPINSSTNAVRSGYRRIFGEYKKRCDALK